MSLDSCSFGVATGYGLEGRNSIPISGRNVSILHRFPTGCGAHPTSHPVGTGGFFSRVKRQGLEADHSPPSNAEVKNGGAVPPVPIRLHGVVLN
jgi:hypothetical protein